MIKAIVFDLWETLITNSREVTHWHKSLRIERITRVLGEHGVRPAPEKIEHAYRASWDRCQELYWSRDRDIPCRTQVEHLLEALEVESFGAMDALEHAYAMVAVDVLPERVPGADDVLRDLSSRFSLGLISNTGRTPGYALRVILDRMNLSRFFAVMVFSNEHGACKPQRSIFEAVRAALGVEFEEMVFVGDNLYVDVYGAQQCGMRGVHFLPPQRGSAVAPDVDHGLTIEPDATIDDLGDLPGVIGQIAAERQRV